jgi:hypothetical protein
VAGEYITDVYNLALPDDLSAGPYQVAVGMYDLASGARLPVTADGVAQPDAQVVLAGDVLARAQ